MNDLLMGVPGVGEVYPGSHICALFSGPAERDRLLVLFLREGLRHGDRCVCFIDEIEPVGMRQRAYGGAGLVDGHGAGRLDMHSAPDAYLRSGTQSPRQTISGLVADTALPADSRPPCCARPGRRPPPRPARPGCASSAPMRPR